MNGFRNTVFRRNFSYTGGTDLGGDWELEYCTAPLDAQEVFPAAALSSYGHLLDAWESFEEVALSLFDKVITTATIVTHGFQVNNDTGDSLFDLADEIRNRIDAANDARHQGVADPEPHASATSRSNHR